MNLLSIFIIPIIFFSYLFSIYVFFDKIWVKTLKCDKNTFVYVTSSALSATISLVIVFFTGVIVANPEWSPNWMKTIHNVFGQISYFLGITCICFSYFYNWTEERERLFLPSLDLRVLITFLTIFLIIWSLAHPIKSLVKHL